MKNHDVVMMIRRAIAGDREMFVKTVEAMAANEEAGGRRDVARSLRQALQEQPTMTTLRWSPPARLAEHATVLDVPLKRPELLFRPDIEAAIAAIVEEHAASEHLIEAGLEPAKRILMCGPPGTGKTSAAIRLGYELRRRVALADGHKMLGSHLGESSAAIAKLFEAIAEFDGLVFFDEIDSIGGVREQGKDGASRENARMVNTLLAVFERDIGRSVIIAATNRRDLLDEALVRRFDTVIEFSRPDAKMIHQLIAQHAPDLAAPARDAIHKDAVMSGWSHAEIVNRVRHCRKSAILAKFRGNP